MSIKSHCIPLYTNVHLSALLKRRRALVLKISTVEARDNFSDLINQAAYGNKRIVLTRRGKALVALIPLTDLQHLELVDHKTTTIFETETEMA